MGSQHRFRFGAIASQAPSGEEWASLARRVEELGYSTLLLPDTLGRTLPPIPALAAAAAATTSLRVGTYVLANDFHHPVQVARDAAALDFLSGGRFELGIGAGRDSGGEEYRILGLPFESGGSRVRRLEESLGILRGLFAGETVSFSGRHYQVEGAEVFPAPVQQPGPPILVAGRGRRMLSLAARFADVVALGLPPESSKEEAKERVELLRQEAGDRFERLELNLNVMAIVPKGQETSGPHVQLLRWLGLSLDELIAARSVSLLMGDADSMAERLVRLREELGISYLAVANFYIEQFAPVVEALSGR